MIKHLHHKVKDEAERIRHVFQVSYAVEAKLLGAENNFPPLKRPLEDFMCSESSFYGFYENERLVAVMELKVDRKKVHIQSLVVDPAFFRKGIASKLLNFLADTFETYSFTVETGAANGPAIALYTRHGFKQVKQWMTEIGIEKVAFERMKR